uniref:Uncharacterized protein n=1 Tax=Chelonoidis abingdonii TaxID=106734 RepID=A0A8C0GXQ0_CHEAB
MACLMSSEFPAWLGFEEFKYLWGNIQKWQVERWGDGAPSGAGSSELPGAFEVAGFRLNEQLYQMIMCRCSDENSHIDFDNFISCLVCLDVSGLRHWGMGQVPSELQEARLGGAPYRALAKAGVR